MASTEDAVKEICGFLREKGLEEEIVTNFEKERMDFAAVIQASDDVLHRLGLSKEEDVLSLRAFAEDKQESKAIADRNGAQKETKRKLFSQKQGTSKRRKDGEQGCKKEEHPKTKVKTRRIQLGWLHFDEQSGRFVSMRLKRGGGTREVDVPLSADVDEIIHIAQEIFFPDGRCEFGNLSDMNVDLANYKCDKLESPMSDDGEPFTLKGYISASKATRIRLYIQTKRKNTEKMTVPSTDDDESKVNTDNQNIIANALPAGEDDVPAVAGGDSQRLEKNGNLYSPEVACRSNVDDLNPEEKRNTDSLCSGEAAYRQYVFISNNLDPPQSTNCLSDSALSETDLEQQRNEASGDGIEDPMDEEEQRSQLQQELHSMVRQLFTGNTIDPDNQQLINIRRSKVWYDASRAFSSSTFSFSRGIRVQFIGEQGVDGGGPRREFYKLLVEEVCRTSGLLEGSDGHKIPAHNWTALKARKFVVLGLMAGMSMLDGGPGLPVFASSVYDYLSTDRIVTGSIEDVPDAVVRQKLYLLDSVETKEHLRRTVLTDEFEFLMDCGYTKPLGSCILDDSKEMVECSIQHFTHYRVRAELDQLKEGLEKMGVLPAMRRRPNIWKPLLCQTEILKINADYTRRLFQPKYSLEGSNYRRFEEDLIYHWEEYLKEMEIEGKAAGKETQVTLEDVFVFLTGSDRIPPMGFERKGAIVFDHIENKQESRLPSVSTCLPQLLLPVCNSLTEDYDIFKEQMNLAVLGSVGYGNL